MDSLDRLVLGQVATWHDQGLACQLVTLCKPGAPVRVLPAP